MVHFHYSKDREKKLDAGGYPLIFQAMGGAWDLGGITNYLRGTLDPGGNHALPSSITVVHYRRPLPSSSSFFKVSLLSSQ